MRDLDAPALLNLVIGVLALGLAYLGVAAAAELWPFEPERESPVRIVRSASAFNPEAGSDPSAEYVCLVNTTDEAVELEGWTLSDDVRVVNVLPELSLPPKGHVKVHPGPGRQTNIDVYGTRGRSVWDNDGDTVTLRDRDGDEMDSQHYDTRLKNDATGVCE